MTKVSIINFLFQLLKCRLLQNQLAKFQLLMMFRGTILNSDREIHTSK